MDKPYNYISFSNNKICYDERKKKFFYVKHATNEERRTFNKNTFKSQRPDLEGNDDTQFSRDLKDGQAYLKGMMHMNKLEMRRLQRILLRSAPLYVYPIMDDYMKQHRVDNPRVNRQWTWRDASLIVEYFREHTMRAAKYGLNITGTGIPCSKESYKNKEDQLVEYFLHEMRKKPVDQAV